MEQHEREAYSACSADDDGKFLTGMKRCLAMQRDGHATRWLRSVGGEFKPVRKKEQKIFVFVRVKGNNFDIAVQLEPREASHDADTPAAPN